MISTRRKNQRGVAMVVFSLLVFTILIPMVALAVDGGVLYLLLSGIPGFATYYMPVSGALLILTVIAQPDGAAPLMQAQWRAVAAALKQKRNANRTPGQGAALGAAEPANELTEGSRSRDTAAIVQSQQS